MEFGGFSDFGFFDDRGGGGGALKLGYGGVKFLNFGFKVGNGRTNHWGMDSRWIGDGWAMDGGSGS